MTCPHITAGCNYPEGECSGACLVGVRQAEPCATQRQSAAPQYLTIVYRITHPGQTRALLAQAEWSAASHTHAIHERDRLTAELNDVQDQRREAFRAIERLNDELGQAREQRDELLAAAQRLAARGWFKPNSCADTATSADMKAMRAAIAKAGGAA